MWIIDLLVIHLNPNRGALARPSTLEVMRARERYPNSLSFHYFHFGLEVESIKELGGVSALYYIIIFMAKYYEGEGWF